MVLQEPALKVLESTSRTFYLPITWLPTNLQEAVGSAYLCMRAIDEIEDHPGLDSSIKIELLRAVSGHLQTGDFGHTGLRPVFTNYMNILPEVTLRLEEWLLIAPTEIAPRIWDATAAMADRMARWATIRWAITTEADLNAYTFSVAGTVGLLLSDLWAWYDGTQTSRSSAVGFGRGLQAVNILRNQVEDQARGVNFFPSGWSREDMQEYAKRNLALADSYVEALSTGPALEFCGFILALAYATLDALTLGNGKLSRGVVLEIADRVHYKGLLAP